jgi:23S rRNA pseudouridine1911/1915/1917 synthase
MLGGFGEDSDMDAMTITVEEGEGGARLDKWAAMRLPELSRSRVQQLLAEGHVHCGDAKVTDPARRIKPCETYSFIPPAAIPLEVPAVAMALGIVYEDADIVVIDKPAGMTVHPAPGHAEDTLVNALLAHCGASLSGIGGVLRPGIVHRIDKDTSGLLVVAKCDAAHQALAAQLLDRSLKREYRAIVRGIPLPPAGRIEGLIGRSPHHRQKMALVARQGKNAVTHYRLLEHFGKASLIECRLETGRTHQIRVHMSHIHHPLLGDKLYGGNVASLFHRQALHACRLRLIHPRSGEEMTFDAPLPEDMQTLLKTLRAGAEEA